MSRIAATVFVLALATPSLAVAADAVGTTGAIAELEVNHSTAETFLQYHGRVVITDGTRATEYRWGGVACSNKALPEGLRFLTLAGMPALLQFPPDMARLPAEVNRLSNQVLVHTFEDEWGRVH